MHYGIRVSTDLGISLEYILKILARYVKINLWNCNWLIKAAISEDILWAGDLIFCIRDNSRCVE